LDDRVNSNKNFQDQALMKTIGVNYNFTVRKDTDNDGVYDKDDKYPAVFGLEKFDGCLDTDEVEDSKDECPNVAGTLTDVMIRMES
jgi:hypothetical protein